MGGWLSDAAGGLGNIFNPSGRSSGGSNAANYGEAVSAEMQRQIMRDDRWQLINQTLMDLLQGKGSPYDEQFKELATAKIGGIRRGASETESGVASALASRGGGNLVGALNPIRSQAESSIGDIRQQSAIEAVNLTSALSKALLESTVADFNIRAGLAGNQLNAGVNALSQGEMAQLDSDTRMWEGLMGMFNFNFGIS